MKIIAAILNLAINSYYTRKLINFSIIKQLSCLRVIIVHSLIMGVVAYGVQAIIPASSLIKLLCRISAGIFYYLLASFLFMKEEAVFILTIIKNKK